ncbi:MAG: SDR family NAD(P)-dependent oxidoreductase [Proteobacteria bacterium]|nr:SDR family NAD(P)-dependent oxidoreductase [Pseudomonadota bacterium]MBU4009575.1 SDR family NAD(P)-dependent oxidoreductase [Pseudomonadota bacterium]
MGKLDGKVAVITGAGRGIGRAAVQLFSKEGAAIVVNDRDEAVAAKSAKDIEDAGGKVMFCVADIVNAKDAQRLMDTAVEKFGGLNILVNCAGITRDAPIHKMTDQQWDMAIDVNLKGTFNCIRAAAKYMRKEGHNGRIINISSISGIRGAATQANYASAKGGIISLTKVVAHEWERFGVTCNCIAYGPVDTRLTRAREEQNEEVAGEKLGVPLKTRKEMMDRYDGRIMSPEDAAHPILFFAQDESWCINGNCLQAALGGFS